jgi:hypothetical protein
MITDDHVGYDKAEALGHRLLNSRRNAAGIFDAGISNIQMSSSKRLASFVVGDLGVLK